MAHEDPTTRSSDGRQPGRRAAAARFAGRVGGAVAARDVLRGPASGAERTPAGGLGRAGRRCDRRPRDWCGYVRTVRPGCWWRPPPPSRSATHAAGRGPLLGAGHRLHGHDGRCAACRPASRSTTASRSRDPDDPQPHRRAGVRHLPHRARERRREGVRFLWSGDLAGQGWGINPDLGGFPHLRGDAPAATRTSSSTAATPSTRTAPIEAKVDAAGRQGLAERHHRGEVQGRRDARRVPRQLPLQPAGRERCAASTRRCPRSSQWDDHEVLNNWYPGEILDDDRYTEKDVDILAARSLRAFSEYFPLSTLPPRDEDGRVYRVVHHGPLLDVFVLDMRTYRNANSPGKQDDDAQGILGARAAELAQARAVALARGVEGDRLRHAAGSGRPGRQRPTSRPSPRATRARRWDVSSRSPSCCGTSSTGASPARCGSPRTCTTPRPSTTTPRGPPSTTSSRSGSSCPGPLNAGGFPALKLDGTFGPEQVFVKAPTKANVLAQRGGQYFGQVDIDGDNGEMTVRLREEGGAVLFTKTLQPGRVGQ